MARSLAQIVNSYGANVISKLDGIALQQAEEMRSDIVEGWPVAAIHGGASRAGWQGPTKVGHAHYRIQNQYDYAAVIEYGGYPGVGPKTEIVGSQVLPGGVAINGGIYPSQRPAAPVRRAISKRYLELQRAIGMALRA